MGKAVLYFNSGIKIKLDECFTAYKVREIDKCQEKRQGKKEQNSFWGH